MQEISYSGQREIAGLVIVNGQGKKVYEFQEKEAQKEAKLGEDKMRDLKKELERTGVPIEKVLERYHVRDASQLTLPMYTNAMNSLKKTSSRKAA